MIKALSLSTYLLLNAQYSNAFMMLQKRPPLGSAASLKQDSANVFLSPLSRTVRLFSSSMDGINSNNINDFHEGGGNKKLLSDEDEEILKSMRERIKEMPILIVDAILPEQLFQFGSNDPRFFKLVTWALQERSEIGIIGINPLTKLPLQVGVTVDLSPDAGTEITVDGAGKGNMLTITAKGSSQFAVQGELWMDETDTFYMGRIELGLFDQVLNLQDQKKAECEASKLPSLVNKWLTLMRKNVKSAREVNKVLKDIGPMPQSNELGKLAMWVVSLINPSPDLGVSVPIRGAMLACRNSYERVQLAYASINASIQHLQSIQA